MLALEQKPNGCFVLQKEEKLCKIPNDVTEGKQGGKLWHWL